MSVDAIYAVNPPQDNDFPEQPLPHLTPKYGVIPPEGPPPPIDAGGDPIRVYYGVMPPEPGPPPTNPEQPSPGGLGSAFQNILSRLHDFFNSLSSRFENPFSR